MKKILCAWLYYSFSKDVGKYIASQCRYKRCSKGSTTRRSVHMQKIKKYDVTSYNTINLWKMAKKCALMAMYIICKHITGQQKNT